MTTQKKTQSGSALVYILVAIALLAALTVSFMEPSGQQTQTQNSTRIVSELYNQATQIQSAIQECVLVYPAEDSTLTSTEQNNSPYPINPADTHFAAETPAAQPNLVENIRCPGNPGGANADHELIFAGSSGKFLPPAPPLFSNWRYYNGADGVFFFIETDKTDPYLATALEKLDEKFAECEADVIDATGGTVNISSDTIADTGVRTCVNGNRCFRVWMILKTGTGHGDGC
ncbi:MAG: hypothetical protein ACPG05_03750 [Bdellovibrionales bacterium]